MPERFISEPIEPVKESFDTSRMSAGEPGLPQVFTWGGKMYVIKDVIKTWRKLGECRHKSGEQYVRKHFYKFTTTTGEIMTVYFERNTTAVAKGPRWWLFSLEARGRKVAKY